MGESDCRGTDVKKMWVLGSSVGPAAKGSFSSYTWLRLVYGSGKVSMSASGTGGPPVSVPRDEGPEGFPLLQPVLVVDVVSVRRVQ